MKEKHTISGSEQVSDPAKALNRIGRNDKAFTLKMLKLFIAAAKECNRKIKSCIKENNWAELKSVAHQHIPTYGIMGLNELADSLKYIDQYAMDNQKQNAIGEMMYSLQAMNLEAIDAVKKYIGLIDRENTLIEANEYNYVT